MSKMMYYGIVVLCTFSMLAMLTTAIILLSWPITLPQIIACYGITLFVSWVLVMGIL